MITFIYAAFAIAFLILTLGFLRKPKHDLGEAVEEQPYAPSISNRRWLDLSERIFDPGDVHWLQDELAFPKLAHSLMLNRKRLAIRWLEALQASFDDFVRTPENVSSEQLDASSAQNWRMLWLTVRFKFLVSYALVMVKVFGPYHQLIPSFAWVPNSQRTGSGVEQAAFAGSRNAE